MPPYYYHLAFELSQRSSDFSDSKASTEVEAPYLPEQNLDIFRDNIPVHFTSTWTSFVAPKKETRRPRSSSAKEKDKAWEEYSSRRRRPSNPRTKTSDSTLAIREKRKSSPEVALAVSAHDSTKTAAQKDWRFSKISVDSIDMESRDALIRSEARPSQRPTAPGATQPLTGRYSPSNPKTTEFGWGVVHLYRDEHDASETRLEKEMAALDDDAAFLDKDCTTLCILAVPSYMTPSDLLGWVGEETRELVSHFRLVRTERSNKFMVLLKFREGETAKKWQREWNGKLFNSMEPENCHVVFIKSISFQAVDDNKDPQSFPDMSNDPFTPAVAKALAASPTDNIAPAHTSNASKSASALGPSLVELPTCPVCLERMDETTGLATIFCQHVFHCACLQKWRGSGCPVCRYTQDDPLHKTKGCEIEESSCRACAATSNLWICLICGHVGCGRYDEAHAQAHFKQSNHAFAMDLEDQRIWDYAGDNYVHRLLQDKSNGKLVELPSAFSSAPRHDVADDNTLPWEKAEKMSHEYTNLITSQLDSQRVYFEEQVDRAVLKASKAAMAAESASLCANEATTRMLAIEASHNTLLNETLPGLEREKSRAERRAERLEALARDRHKESQEKEAMNESLIERVKLLQEQVEGLTKSKSELEETNRDLMGYISCIEKLKDAGEEVVGGTVTVGDAPNKKKRNGRKR